MKPRSAAPRFLFLFVAVLLLVGAAVSVRPPSGTTLSAGEVLALDADAAALRRDAETLASERVQDDFAASAAAVNAKITADINRAKEERLNKAREDSQRAARSQKRTVAPGPRPTERGPATGDLLDALARCESGGNPQAVGGGGRFYGAFQFMLKTWRNLVARLGLPYSGDPRNHSYAEQKLVVQRGIPVSSWRGQFPHCARVLGVA